MKDDDKDHDLERASKKAYIEKVDYMLGLRGLCCLVVYSSHTFAWWYGPSTDWAHGFGYHGEYMFVTMPLVRTMFTGGNAVPIFFVVSGYCLTVTPLRLLQRRDYQELRRYLITSAIKRPFRLYTPVAAVSLAMIAVMHLPFGLAPYLQFPKAEPNILAELWKWTQEFGWMLNFTHDHDMQSSTWFPYIPPVWTMPAELAGSLALYVMLGMCSFIRHTQAMLMLATMGIVLLFCGQWAIAAFAFGAIIAFVGEWDRSRSRRLSRLPNILNNAACFCGWFLLGQPIASDPEMSYATPGWFFLTEWTPSAYQTRRQGRFWPLIGSTMLVYAITQLPWAKTFLRRPLLSYFGLISFALYLVHVPTLWIVGDRLGRAFGKRRLDFDTVYDDLLPIPDLGVPGFSSGFLIWQSILFPINLWLSGYITRYADIPSIKFSKLVATRLERYC